MDTILNTQCTIGKAKKIENKKCLKVNIFFVLKVIPLGKGEKVPFFATNIFFVIYFGVFGRKTGRAGPIISKLYTKGNQVVLKKEPRKRKCRQPLIVNLGI